MTDDDTMTAIDDTTTPLEAIPVPANTARRLGQLPERCHDASMSLDEADLALAGGTLRYLYRCPICDGIFLHDPAATDRAQRGDRLAGVALEHWMKRLTVDHLGDLPWRFCAYEAVKLGGAYTLDEYRALDTAGTLLGYRLGAEELDGTRSLADLRFWPAGARASTPAAREPATALLPVANLLAWITTLHPARLEGLRAIPEYVHIVDRAPEDHGWEAISFSPRVSPHPGGAEMTAHLLRSVPAPGVRTGATIEAEPGEVLRHWQRTAERLFAVVQRLRELVAEREQEQGH